MVFRGTRVPVQTLLEYLERDYTLGEFLECFPTVNRELACAVLEDSEAAMRPGEPGCSRFLEPPRPAADCAEEAGQVENLSHLG